MSRNGHNSVRNYRSERGGPHRADATEQNYDTRGVYAPPRGYRTIKQFPLSSHHRRPDGKTRWNSLSVMSCRTDRRKVSYPWSGDPQKGGVRRVHPLSEVEERFRGRLGCHPCRVVETPPPTAPAHHGQHRSSRKSC